MYCSSPSRLNYKFIAFYAPYVKDAYWFWAGMPYPNLEKALLHRK